MVQPKIIVLDPQTANQIAAGEIVERPASVVKELVENAIDAQAKHIRVEIKNGGKDYIRVEDDGWGMDARDAVLAFARHATSKIRRAEDLFCLRTLGFRGEALPSIAAVARVEMITRPSGVPLGTRVRVEGGKQTTVEEAGCRQGTVVTVTDLFFNTPARRRYLKKPATEAAQVAGVIERLALAHPEIAFQLIIEGRRSLSTPGNNDLRSSIAAVWGLETAEALLPVNGSVDEEGSFCGFVSPPWLHRYGREQQILIVNGRYIMSRTLNQEIEAVYHHLIPAQRHPIFILHLNLPAAWLDVNVHPSKLLIRIKDEEVLAAHLGSAIGRALRTPQSVMRKRLSLPTRGYYFNDKVNEDGDEPEISVAESRDYVYKNRSEPEEITQEDFSFRIREPGRDEGKEGEVKEEGLPALRVIGQLLNTYILAEGEEGLYIIDQHAAHERYRFEQLKQQRHNQGWAAQLVEPPQVLRLTAPESLELITKLKKLENLGFAIEPFGTNTFLLRGAPAGMVAGQEKEVLEELLKEEDPENLGSLEDKLLRLIACHGAVKAGDRLSQEEMEMLVNHLATAQHPYTCPHGRPAVVKITRAALSRYFSRPASPEGGTFPIG